MKSKATPTASWMRCLPVLLGCLLGLSQARAQSYCNSSLGGTCTGNEITSVSFNTLTNTSTCTNVAGSGAYTDYPASTVTTSVVQGSSPSLTVETPNGASIISMWIDYDHNGNFDSYEWQQVTTNNTLATITVNIPLSATTGTTGMRIRSRAAGSPNGAGDACTTFYSGETEDYTITITAAPPCSGVPATPTVSPAGPVSSCAGGTIAFAAQVAPASGYTYQWQQSVNGGTTWTDIAGAIAQFYTAPVTGNAQYRVKLTCGAVGGGTSTSAAVVVTAATPTYGTLPYSTSFEDTWQNFCAVQDVPSSNWTNQPAVGEPSWRRDDDETSAPWNSPWGLYYPTSSSGSHSARWNVNGSSLGDTGNLDLYLNCSAVGSKQLYFDFIHQYSTDDSLLLFLSTDGGATFSFLKGYDTAINWTRKSLAIASNSAQTVLRFQAKKTAPFSYSDIGIDSVVVVPPCTGAPTAGTIAVQGGICAGGTVTFSTTGTTLAGNLIFQWQKATSSTGPWTAIAGATSPTYTTTLLASSCYRLVVTCAGSGQSAQTAAYCVTIVPPSYATLPYIQGFESWSSRCSTNDLPDSNWTNQPSDGDLSWRRDDDGSNANWISPSFGEYLPASIVGSHSARFHASYAPSGQVGAMDLYVNASAAGTKELQFYYRNDGPGYPPFGAVDSLRITYSTDNGLTFNPLLTLDTTVGWTYHAVPLTAYTAQTIIRFQGVADYGSTDIGLDAVRVLLPCSGKPTAGTIATQTPCPNTPFSILLTGTSAAGGLTYIWQQSPSATGPWTTVAGANKPLVTTSISAATYFRAIVTCSNGGQRDTTAAVLFPVKPYYQCYCNTSVPYTGDYEDIGNVTITQLPGGAVVLDNGNPLPPTNNFSATGAYSDFTNLTPDTLYHADSYQVRIAGITNDIFFYDSNVDVYLDLNHDGVYDPIAELVMNKVLIDPSQIDSATFTIPATASIGLTGMRVVLSEGTWSPPGPCGSYWAGETEDYLVYVDYPPCSGIPTVGTMVVSDSMVCPQDVILLTNTTHQRNASGISWQWEESLDSGATWSVVSGSVGKDSIQVPAVGGVQYRFSITCGKSGQTVTTNTVTLRIKPPYKCYCYAYATGGAAADNSDIGSFTLGNFVVNTGGAHLNNPTAVQRYTDWTDLAVAELEADSTYEVSAYQILKTGTHADAKVSLFIDFNNNWHYDLPDERVWMTYTSAADPYVTGKVTIPSNVTLRAFTGMRLILNEDVGLNDPSDTACGMYQSGETEDYLVRFRTKGTAGIPGAGGLLQEAALYPNPTTGQAILQLQATHDLKDLTLRVSDITGRTLYQQAFSAVPARFQTSIDLSTQPRGVYFIELRTDGDRLVRKLVVQ